MLTNDKADPNPLKRYRQEKTHMIQVKERMCGL